MENIRKFLILYENVPHSAEIPQNLEELDRNTCNDTDEYKELVVINEMCSKDFYEEPVKSF